MRKMLYLFCCYFLFASHALYPLFAIGEESVAYDCCLDQTEKIIMVGNASAEDGKKFLVARYTSEGFLDTSFNSVGVVITMITQRSSASAVVVQADGKIVVTGRADNKIALVRYNSDGTLDTSFGVGGIQTTLFHQGTGAHGIALQADGKIVIVGITIKDGLPKLLVVRYTATGSLDSSFGNGGSIIEYLDQRSEARGVVIQSDGKIVVAGNSQNTLTGQRYFGLIRYTATGQRDATFGNNGLVSTAIGTVATATSLAIDSNGKIIVAGSSDKKSIFARYTPAGALDATFGMNGIVTINPNVSSSILKVAESGGKIIGVGYIAPYFLITRLNGNGTLDTSFAGNGCVKKQVQGTTLAWGLSVQSDGKLIVAGQADNGLFVSRYMDDGYLDTSFGNERGISSQIKSEGDSIYSPTEPRQDMIAISGAQLAAPITSKTVSEQILFSTIRFKRGFSISYNDQNDAIELNEAGAYRIVVSVTYSVTAPTSHSNLATKLLLDGVELPDAHIYTSHPKGSNSQLTSTFEYLFEKDKGGMSTISVQAVPEQKSKATMSLVSNGCGIIVEKVG